MIALDVMGGDKAPRVTIQGAFFAAQKGVPILLCGDERVMIKELEALSSSWRTLSLTIKHCPDVITMDDDPVRSVRAKKKSSLVTAVKAVASGQAQAVVSAGNSGAALVAGMLLLGCSKGVLRPALGSFMPTKRGSVLCLDLGANADCKPEYLEQFALMGHLLVWQQRGIEKPRVGLLTNGVEPYKGSLLIKKVYQRLAALPINFVGNIEARDIYEDLADVLICDGFTGNIMLKTAQGTAQAVAFWLEHGLKKTYAGRIAYALFGRRVLQSLHEKVDHTQKGGGLLWGLRYPLVVVHGSCGARAIERSLVKAHTTVQKKLIPTFNMALSELLGTRVPFVYTVPQKIRSLLRFGHK